MCIFCTLLPMKYNNNLRTTQIDPFTSSLGKSSYFCYHWGYNLFWNQR